jgi:hypothetical protein
MRKYILSILVSFSAVLFCSNTQAQGIKLGLTANPHVSWMSSDASKVSGDGSIMGFNFGLNTDFFFTDQYAITTGLYINNLGGKLQYRDTSSFSTGDGTQYFEGDNNVRYRIQYIEVPLAVKMQTNPIGYFQYFAQFGLSNQFRVNATADLSAQDISSVEFKDEVNMFNIGYSIGGGANYYFSKRSAITASLVYTNGFTDITSNEEVDDTAVLKSITLKVGLIF